MVSVACLVCGATRVYIASTLRVRGCIKYCSQECSYVGASALGVPVPDVTEAIVTARFLQDCNAFLTHVRVQEDIHSIHDAERVIFEGAQGLRLDEHAYGFPHVTRSRTGLPNIAALLSHEGRLLRPADTLQAYYMTRSYVTRHGAGPLSHELPAHPSGWTGPETNITNGYQGALRYATLDARELGHVIADDLAEWEHANGPDIDPALIVTCVDQHPVDVDMLTDVIGIRVAGVSHGPTRADVREIGRSTDVSIRR